MLGIARRGTGHRNGPRVRSVGLSLVRQFRMAALTRLQRTHDAPFRTGSNQVGRMAKVLFRAYNMYDGRGTAAHVRSRRSVLPTMSKTFAIETPMVGWESHRQSGAPSRYTQLRTGSVALAYCHFRSWAPIVQSPGAAAVTAFTA